MNTNNSLTQRSSLMEPNKISTLERKHLGSDRGNDYSSSAMGPNIIDLEKQDLSGGEIKDIHR